ncbi:MAG TPA: LacI family transcriptional regulator [Acidimicrobiales bacterium]|nr:LacI family transcriptional regulator [Acidimicrobiales bacterium]
MSPPTMEDVARAAGVSRALVSLVMRQAPNVSDERRARVIAAAEELGYRPNAVARSLASRRTHTIGVLLNDLHNPFFADSADGIIEEASSAGYQVLMATGTHVNQSHTAAIESFLNARVDGIILVGPRFTPEQISDMASHVPVLTLGSSSDGHGVDSVKNDEYRGACLAVEHLAGLGHTRITHVSGGRGAGADSRRQGYARAMADLGLADHVDVVVGDFTEESGAEAADELLKRAELPTAVFSANDIQAAGLMGRLAEAGIGVPEMVSVVGYDDTTFAGLYQLSLTTIHQPVAEMGRQSVRSLLDRMVGGRTEPRKLVIEPSLVVRRSTAPPR